MVVLVIAFVCIIKCYFLRKSAFQHLVHPVSRHNCRETRTLIEVSFCFLEVDNVFCFLYYIIWPFVFIIFGEKVLFTTWSFLLVDILAEKQGL